MKILYVTTIGTTMIFFKSLVKDLINLGHTVDIACNFSENDVPEFYNELNCKKYQIFFSRSPFSRNNIKSAKCLNKIIVENKYDIIHCHTPIASVITRFVCRNMNVKVIYTAHGFHFYKSAPLINWLIYYPIEKICSKWTDLLITINKEDYEIAKRKLYAKDVKYIPGVGINYDDINNILINEQDKRKELGVPNDSFLIVSVGELNTNKNHSIIIKALHKINNPIIHYCIVGAGEAEMNLKQLTNNLNLCNQIHFLGYRNDVIEIYKCADVCCFPSIREGLGLAAIEGMACGLPLIAADNRGTRSYAINGRNSMVCSPFDVDGFQNAINKLFNDRELCKILGKNAKNDIELFDVHLINSQMVEVYSSIKNEAL